MGKKRRPPPSVSAEDIDRDLAEMRHSPITRPNLSFLGPPQKAETPSTTAPVDIAVDISSPDTTAAAATLRAKEYTAPAVFTPDLIKGVLSTPVVLSSAAPQPRPVHYCLTAQDGHSPTEHLIYSVMWTLGRPEFSAEDTARLVQMSQPELARRVGITERNLRIAIIRLIDKLALEEVAGYTKDTKAPRVYRVFSEGEVLRRRREAGLLWVVRRKGVQFVRITGENSDAVYTTPAVITSVVTAGPVTHATDPYPASIASAFREQGIPLTPAVAARLWRECRRRIPDCTAEEVGALLQSTLAGLRSRCPAHQVVEQLLSEWPQRTDPVEFEVFREARRTTAEIQRKIDEDNRRYWESVASDTGAQEADRVLARKILETL